MLETAEAPAPASPRPKMASKMDEALTYSEKSRVVEVFHFNDVYNVEGFKKEPVGGAARFRTAIREHEEAVVVFSGDAFAPSVMSTMLRGAQMPPVLSKLGIDVAMLGNHDFDFGLERCEELVGQTNFPWLLSNAKLKATGEQLGKGLEYVVLDRKGRRFGFVGLIEFEWLSTLASISIDQVEYEDFCSCAERLSAVLRRDHKCDCVIALTHMRQPNDVRLASEKAGCLDLILGGHDHHYEVLDVNGIVVCKSGTDFKDATVLRVDFPDDDGRPSVSSRDRVVVDSSFAEDPDIKAIVDSFGTEVEKSLDEPLADLADAADARFKAIRTSETNLGDLVADVIRQACGADCALLNSGTLRSDVVHAAGPFTKRDLVQLLPMADEMCVLSVDGATLLAALENAVSMWPRLEGRFAQVSGVRFTFDASKPANARVADVLVADAPLDLAKTYTLAIKQYLHSGRDGYDMLPPCAVHTDSEALPALQNMLANYLAAHRDAPLPIRRDGRIRQVGADPVVEPLDGAPAQ